MPSKMTLAGRQASDGDHAANVGKHELAASLYLRAGIANATRALELLEGDNPETPPVTVNKAHILMFKACRQVACLARSPGSQSVAKTDGEQALTTTDQSDAVICNLCSGSRIARWFDYKCSTDRGWYRSEPVEIPCPLCQEAV